MSHADELIDAGRVHEARRILSQFLGRRHLDPRMLPALAALYLRVEKPEMAVRTMNQAIGEAPGDPELHNTLGLIFAKLGREGASRAEFERALEIEPSNADALRNLAFILHRSGERSSAYALLVRCFHAAPMSVELRLICGTLLELDGDLDDAANCYRDAMELGGVSEQVALATHRMFALGDDRPEILFEDIVAHLEREHVVGHGI
ncbi:MAG: tetratricopeptide repeat protein [bacterium]|nr:tetratricopeptide repeat protein [Candidatus Kapabacteria bacterium]